MRRTGRTKGSDCELTYAGKEPKAKVISSTPPARLKRIGTFGENPDGWANMLIEGDNLRVLKSLLGMKENNELKNRDGSPGVRLIYIDPPFSTGLRFKGKKAESAYDDKLTGSKFIEFIRKRIIFFRELLTEDGSVYVHLDWKKAHYIKVIMDEVFGEDNFLNDIIWSYGGRGAKFVSGKFPRNHDVILSYRKSSHIFNRTFIERRLPKGANGFKKDESGRWFKTSPRGDYTNESVAALSKEGRIYRTKKGNIRIKYFVREDGEYLIEDKLVGDVWDDIPDAMHLSEAEKTGYPTQKPEALLGRIIKTSTRPGDIVLDAFAGAGTSLVAAEKLNRRWIGIDSGRLSTRTIRDRLLKINGTRGIETPGLYYSRPLRPFYFYRAG